MNAGLAFLATPLALDGTCRPAAHVRHLRRSRLHQATLLVVHGQSVARGAKPLRGNDFGKLVAPEVVGAPRATPAAVFSRASGPDRGLFGRGRYVSRACPVNIGRSPRRYMQSSTKEEQRDPPPPPSSVQEKGCGNSHSCGTNSSHSKSACIHLRAALAFSKPHSHRAPDFPSSLIALPPDADAVSGQASARAG